MLSGAELVSGVSASYASNALAKSLGDGSTSIATQSPRSGTTATETGRLSIRESILSSVFSTQRASYRSGVGSSSFPHYGDVFGISVQSSQVLPSEPPSPPYQPSHTPFKQDDIESEGVAEPLLPKFHAKPQDAGPVQNKRSARIFAALYGLINTVFCYPLVVPFAAIIFTDEVFRPYMSVLVKQIFLACAIHQAVFLIRSPMPFSVVRATGTPLMFLAAMAKSIAEKAAEEGLSSEETVGATLITMALSTLLIGILTVATGYLKLAAIVQYVPLPVVGGYLGYLGFFCLPAGAFLTTGVKQEGWSSYLELFSIEGGWDSNLVKLMLAVISAILLYCVVRYARHFSALPATLFGIPLLFLAVWFALGRDLQDGMDKGWIAEKSKGGGQFWELWMLYDFGALGRTWHIVALQIPKILALYVISTFGSCMDISAVQQEYDGELDFNHELISVGLSNIVAGAVGSGFMGSYTFSQTALSMRAGVTSRVNGGIVALSGFILFLVPFSPTDVMPVFFFGAMTLWIGWDILWAFMFESFRKVTRMEYLLFWVTFGAFAVTGLLQGLLWGVLAASLHFAYSYSKVGVTAFNVVPSRGSRVRNMEQRSILELFSGNIVAISLSGYIFFGSTVGIHAKAKQVAKRMIQENQYRPVIDHNSAVIDALNAEKTVLVEQAVRMAPKFLLMDFRRVNGIDASAASSFYMLCRTLKQLGVELVITHLPKSRPEITKLLLSHEVITVESSSEPFEDGQLVTSPVRAFESMEMGLNYCEDIFLAVAAHLHLIKPEAPKVKLSEVLRSSLTVPRTYLSDEIDFNLSAMQLMQYIEMREFGKGQVVFKAGDAADAVYIIEKGKIESHLDLITASKQTPAGSVVPESLQIEGKVRVLDHCPGSLVGEIDFILRRPRTFDCSCTEDCSVMCITAEAVERMSTEAPKLLSIVQAIMLRSTSLSVSHALQALERAGLEH